ncbi:O-antigen biosynthesis protein [Methylomarinovum tepidoasis]|uniref:O-antigen biosynthesis protein n=1 Tax=Methylomarinovum tepidoasis TaxID=2840183 RepID=A0AAU9C3I3_9GAMM|nr:glycosyltransferase [Methylomarinovum sp. IN45]BCX87972.1 O-antigen biosynthesis protein [Methylomarinovum sp. IN45]
MFRRACRRFIGACLRPLTASPSQWRWLRLYPSAVPNETLLRHWAESEWPDYQLWIEHNTIVTQTQWFERHRQATAPNAAISIVTPVRDTPAEILRQCILSVRMQTSPYWEWILVDDASRRPETKAVLASPLCRDPRIRIFSAASPLGISGATNLGIAQARGEFIVFLDHDDRLAWDAVQSVAEVLDTDPGVDIIYSDRDMLSPGNKRFMHLMKPDWSPETLLSGNYIFHLMAYRRRLVQQVGGLRSAYDGSQDYDLILRCMEYTDRIRHIPRVLYHWRQHGASVALNDESKAYAFDAGRRALQDALQRRGITAKVIERHDLWRGHYQVRLPLPSQKSIQRILLPPEKIPGGYRNAVMAMVDSSGRSPYLLIRRATVVPVKPETEQKLVSWLALEGVGIVTGKTVDAADRLVYAGAVLTAAGRILRPYRGFPVTEPGYMAVTAIERNLSAPDPYCVAIRREVWNQLEGLDPDFQGPYALLDFALRALARGWRIVFVPSAVFRGEKLSDVTFTESERRKFLARWGQWLRKGDPAYNPNLSQSSEYYELAVSSVSGQG